MPQLFDRTSKKGSEEMEMQKDEFYRQSKNPKNLHILNRIVDAAREDGRIVSVISYGSYTREDFDKFSDIEFYIFIRDDSADTFNDEQWLREVAPVEFYFTNSHGVKTAVFSKFFVRGEFHFHSEKEISVLDTWRGVVLPGKLEKTVLLDKSGEFRKKIEEFCKTFPTIDEEASFKQNYLELANGIIMEWGVLSRKDLFRASTIHSMNLHYLARLLSLLHGETDHLYSPRLLDRFLSRTEFENFSSCFASLNFDSLRTALENTARFSAELSKKSRDRDIARATEALLERVVMRSYRLEGVISDGMKVLLIKHSGNDGRPDDWLLPGGGKLSGESDETAVKREILEETCLDIEPQGMIAEIELPKDGLYYSAKIFHFEYDDSSVPSPGSEPEDENEAYYTISEVKWIDLSDLSRIPAEYRSFPHMPERLEAIREHLLKRRNL